MTHEDIVDIDHLVGHMVEPGLAVRQLVGGEPEDAMVIGGFGAAVEPGEDADDGGNRFVGGGRLENVGRDDAEMGVVPVARGGARRAR